MLATTDAYLQMTTRPILENELFALRTRKLSLLANWLNPCKKLRR